MAPIGAVANAEVIGEVTGGADAQVRTLYIEKNPYQSAGIVQKLYPVLLFIGAALCFYAGYTMGSKHPTYVVVESAPAKSPVVEEIAEPEPVVESVPESIPEVDEADNRLATRAAEQWITFADMQGRTLVAEVIEVEKDSLKIRRQADAQVLDLPVRLLSPEDQAFAAYLWQQAEASKPVEAEPDFDAIFGDAFK